MFVLPLHGGISVYKVSLEGTILIDLLNISVASTVFKKKGEKVSPT
jgi:hypothetical protein